MVFRVGLTGGIGSGKTTASDHFATLGVEIIDADIIAHQVTANGEPILQEIATIFGARALDHLGALDRDFIRSEVFADPLRRQRLEALLHPVIRARMELAARQSTSTYCILSIPLLVESGDTARVDRVLVIDTPESLRRRWVQARSGLSHEQIDHILAAQASREQRLAQADDVIVNDGSLESLYRRVEDLHQIYLEIARTSRGD